jgi:hypothetical protein
VAIGPNRHVELSFELLEVFVAGAEECLDPFLGNGDAARGRSGDVAISFNYA